MFKEVAPNEPNEDEKLNSSNKMQLLVEGGKALRRLESSYSLEGDDDFRLCVKKIIVAAENLERVGLPRDYSSIENFYVAMQDVKKAIDEAMEQIPKTERYQLLEKVKQSRLNLKRAFGNQEQKQESDENGIDMF